MICTEPAQLLLAVFAMVHHLLNGIHQVIMQAQALARADDTVEPANGTSVASQPASVEDTGSEAVMPAADTKVW